MTFEEFLIATSFINSNQPSRALDFAFDIYDEDNNGKIDIQEMERITIALYELEGMNPAEAVSKVKEAFQVCEFS